MSEAVMKENKKNHRYIEYISEVCNTYGSGYSIYGKIGRREYYQFTLKEAMKRYNYVAKLRFQGKFAW